MGLSTPPCGHPLAAGQTPRFLQILALVHYHSLQPTPISILFGFIIHKNQFPTPGSLNSLRFSPPCPFLCCLSCFSFLCNSLEHPKLMLPYDLLQASHSQSNVHSPPLVFLMNSLPLGLKKPAAAATVLFIHCHPITLSCHRPPYLA